MQVAVYDTLYHDPIREISEFLDPGLFERWHTAGTAAAPPFLETGPASMVIQPLIIPVQQGQWVFWGILLGLAILTMTNYYYRKRLKLLGLSILKRSAALQLTRESPVHAHQSFIPLFGIYIISFLLLINVVGSAYSPGSTTGLREILYNFQFLGIYIALFILKIIFIWLISVVFKNQDTGVEYIQTILIFNLVIGIILLPMLLLIVYTWPIPMVMATAAIALLVMGLRFIRGVAIGLSDTKFSLFHLFLYLCTLEILPLVVAAKFFSKYFFT